MAKNNDQQFASLRVVGGLLGSKVLQEVRFYKLPGQSPSDYGVEKGLKLNDELSRYWRIAQTRWQEYKQQLQRTDISQNKLAQQDWLLPLLEKVLGYSVDASPRITLGEREFPVTHTTHNKTLPLVLCGSDKDLDKGDAIFGQEGRKRSPMGLAQEYLNAETHCLWAIVSNGTHLRLLRDNPAMTRPAYIEVDFARLFDEDNYADFATLWLLLHSTRTNPQDGSTEKCWLEQWRSKSLDEGERIVEGLRYGVADALRQLGTGFVAHPENQALREKLSSGELTREAYFQQVLRLVYRLLFLLTAEDREIALLPGDENKAARTLYEKGYSVTSLRDRARFKRYYDLYGDAWQQLLICFAGFADGQPLLAQPALGGLFAPSQCVDLDTCKLQNRHLYKALFNLCYFDNKGTRSRINYRDMNTEEFGSVYEALLELTPQLHTEGQWRFSFQGDAEGEQAASGNARKLSGSYYTPDSLVQELIKSALVPVIEARLQGKVNQKDRRDALLSITVCDPACGSGHFLLGAARRLAAELAQIDADSDQPTEQHYRHALRDVLAHCVFGVDKNPMAIELARVAMWIEGVEPGRALSFLDHHLVCGDALIGITNVNQLQKGISAGAFKPLLGDKKEVCNVLAKANKEGIKGFERLFDEFNTRDEIAWSVSALHDLQKLEALPDNTAGEIVAKEQAYAAILNQESESRLSRAADIFVGAFLLHKTKTNDPIPTSKTLYLELFSDSHSVEHKRELSAAREICVKARVLHWPLVFPQIFFKGGFDCVLGNPPWEVSQLNEKEYFERVEPNIAKLEGDKRKKAIDKLKQIDEIIWNNYQVEKRLYESFSHFIKDSGRFIYSNSGKINSYSALTETASEITKKDGAVGLVAPQGLITDESNQYLFSHLMQEKGISSIVGFKEIRKIFSGAKSPDPFCLVTISSLNSVREYRFFLDGVADLLDGRRVFNADTSDFSLINPHTKTCPLCHSKKDFDLVKKIYKNSYFKSLNQSGWILDFRQGLVNMTADSNLFVGVDSLKESERGDGVYFDDDGGEYVPLYEAKMCHQYDHRWATWSKERSDFIDARPDRSAEEFSVGRYYLKKEDVKSLYEKQSYFKSWIIGWRNNGRATLRRTLLGVAIPAFPVGNSINIIFPDKAVKDEEIVCLLGNVNALICDFVIKQKLGGPNINQFYFAQLPFLARHKYSPDDIKFIVERVVELVYTSSSMRGFAEDLGYFCEPFSFDKYRRAVLTAELDVYYAKLYGLDREDLLYILDPEAIMGEGFPSESFRVLKSKDESEFGVYRTKELVLEAWDRLHNENAKARIISQQIDSLINITGLPDRAWIRPHLDQRAEMGVQLIALLKALSSPVQPRLVRRAVVFALEPRLLNPFLTNTELASWQRLIGAEANAASTNQSQFVARANQFWGAAVRFAITNGYLLEDSQSGIWSSGTQLDQFPVADWADGRARMVLSVLARQSDESKFNTLPVEFRDWIDAAAA